ncbi:hypothetical protein GCK32_001574 [Trichostrongylus colubriformis]|uniref:SUN domain-containing protein n=1 Tax=Trichostrongylus colubriformis TaxID=6319 RepID=A0AAN8IKI4_TRICO
MSSATPTPSLEEMYRRRPSFDRPPIRALDSPRLTEEEADQLTSPFLNYSTGYTYAFSQAYNPDKPPAWEVPNIINNHLTIASPEYAPYHFSAPSMLRKTWQTGTGAVWYVISSVLWLLHAVTIRPVKAVGLMLYDFVDWIFYGASNFGEWVSGRAYKRRDYKANRAYAGTPSTLQMISIIFSKFLYSLGRVVRAPVDLISGTFHSFYLALSRMYHMALAKKSRHVVRENAMKRLYEPSEQYSYSSSRYQGQSKYQDKQEEEYDSDFIDDEEESDEPGPSSGYGADHHEKPYYLRSRAINAEDSEDDTPSVRMRKNVRFDMSSHGTGQGYSAGHAPKVPKARRIATWLGSAASSMVYYTQNGVNSVISCVRKPFDAISETYSYYTGSESSPKTNLSPLRLRSGNRYSYQPMNKYSNESYRGVYDDDSSSWFNPELKSLASKILYAPCRAFLFVAFAAADLCRWLFTRVPAAFVWLWETGTGIVTSVFSRRRRWMWWLLPLVILLLLLLSRRGANDRLIILGHDVSDLHEKVSNYAYSLVDSNRVYAKSLNSIYDEYWRSGKESSYSLLTRITSTISNGFLLITTVFKTAVDLLATSLRDLTTFVIDFFANTGHDTYKRLPTVASFKSSAHDVLASTEKHLSHGLISISNLVSMLVSGLRNWCHMIWSGIMSIFFIIGSAFQRSPLAVIEQKASEIVHEPLRTTTTIQDPVDSKSNIVYVPSQSPAIDETKLIEKISAIVRAKMDQDLKAKLETELKSLITSYEQKLSNLKVEKHRTEVDYAHLESLIRAAIYEYDSDKTGMFDFALESAGASIISTRCSENYDTYTRLEKIWNIPLWYSSYGPRTVIQRNSKTLFPGECWSFKGPVGYITIGLSHPINVTIVSYEHIGAHQAPGGERPSAPRTFKIWAYKSEADMSTRVLLGDFMYDIKGSPLQFFVIKTQPDYPVQIIEMEVTSNYGAEYTSLYRLRVHGSLYKPGHE